MTTIDVQLRAEWVKHFRRNRSDITRRGVALGQRAVALLRLLTERAGQPVSKDDLIECAWPGLSVEESNLTVQIAALRPSSSVW